MKIPVGIIDDHQLFLKSLSLMLASFKDYHVVLEALNGKDLQEKIALEKRITRDHTYRCNNACNGRYCNCRMVK